MAASTAEWTGLQQFPAATQQALVSLLRKLQSESVSSLTVLLLGKSGVGKSSTVNSIFNERVVMANAFQSETMRPMLVGRTSAGFTLNIIDTPGLVEAGCVNDQAIDLIRRFLLNRTIDVMLYVDRLDEYRVNSLDRQVIKAIAGAFGPQVWKIGVLVLTHAQFTTLPDDVSYSDFVVKRTAAFQEAIRQEAGLRKHDPPTGVALVENSFRCLTNEEGEKVLPNNTVWLPNLVQSMVDVVVANRAHAILVDEKLIDGPNANKRGKILIPLILLAQWFLVVKPLVNAIKRDVDEEVKRKPGWEATLEDRRQRKVRAQEAKDRDDVIDEDDENDGKDAEEYDEEEEEEEEEDEVESP